MLKIQVFGRGMIPRGLGLAPRKNPFMADLSLIGIIMDTPGLTVKYINPEDGRSVPLTRQNLKKVWEKYGKTKPNPSAVPVQVPNTGITPDTRPDLFQGETVTKDPIPNEEEKKEEKEKSTGFSVVTSPDKEVEKKEVSGIQPVTAPEETKKEAVSGGGFTPVTRPEEKKVTTEVSSGLKPVTNPNNEKHNKHHK